MLNCRNTQKLSYHKFACPNHPEKFIVVPHSCKSRFCNTCGNNLTDEWIAKVEKNFPQSSFRHIYFTIPDYLQLLLDKNRFLLNCLFRCCLKNHSRILPKKDISCQQLFELYTHLVETCNSILISVCSPQLENF